MKTRDLIPRDVALLRAKLEYGAIPVPESGCYLWTLGCTSAGYGALYIARVQILAHRAAWIVSGKALPNGMMICHKCDTRRCVNPEHLFLGDAQENMRDMIYKGRQDFQVGQSHSNAKLTDAQVIAMRKSGLNSTDAGVAFGVADCTASRILNGHSWKHLPMFPEIRRNPRRHVGRGRRT